MLLCTLRYGFSAKSNCGPAHCEGSIGQATRSGTSPVYRCRWFPQYSVPGLASNRHRRCLSGRKCMHFSLGASSPPRGASVIGALAQRCPRPGLRAKANQMVLRCCASVGPSPVAKTRREMKSRKVAQFGQPPEAMDIGSSQQHQKPVGTYKCMSDQMAKQPHSGGPGLEGVTVREPPDLGVSRRQLSAGWGGWWPHPHRNIFGSHHIQPA